MNINDISTQLLYTTVPILVETQSGQSSGTSFILSIPAGGDTRSSIPFLVTNYHVVKDAKRAIIALRSEGSGVPAKQEAVRIEIPAEVLLAHTNPAQDIAAIPFGPILSQLTTIGRRVLFRSVDAQLVPAESVINELAAMEEIIFVGYPSGLYDSHNVSPIIRKGITATPTWNNFEGEACFLIDAGVFPGSSGSPVFIMNQGSFPTKDGLAFGKRLLFLGMITQTLLRGEKVFLGLGVVLKSAVILEFVDSLKSDLLASGAANKGT